MNTLKTHTAVCRHMDKVIVISYQTVYFSDYINANYFQPYSKSWSGFSLLPDHCIPK